MSSLKALIAKFEAAQRAGYPGTSSGGKATAHSPSGRRRKKRKAGAKRKRRGHRRRKTSRDPAWYGDARGHRSAMKRAAQKRRVKPRTAAGWSKHMLRSRKRKLGYSAESDKVETSHSPAKRRRRRIRSAVHPWNRMYSPDHSPGQAREAQASVAESPFRRRKGKKRRAKGKRAARGRARGMSLRRALGMR